MTDAEVLKVVVDTVAVSVLRCDPASIMEWSTRPCRPSASEAWRRSGGWAAGVRCCEVAGSKEKLAALCPHHFSC